MKLVRYGNKGAENPGLIDGAGALRDLSGHVADIDAMATSAAGLARLGRLDPSSLPAVAGKPRLGVPVAEVGKIVAIGLNYSDHAAEAGMQVPKEPVVFMKATSALSGPFDPVMLPKDSAKTDWEVELAVVIGTTARYVEEKDALRFVAGYTICNDVSERSYQLERGGTWDKGKSCDSFAPLGPWLVTGDEVPDPQRLGLWLEVNGTRMQRGSTANMIFGVAVLVAYVSRFMTLLPGDVLITGTPAGVGMGRKPPQYLKPGDVMRLGIDALGEQRQEVVAWRAG
ncbi:MAG: fumarylacetoacetate hydrolase family protein [Proteobacteria bacterium]|nr:fumarylacetoacetate hydrolase family protein [Pseudomonadota bacterium]